MKVVVVLLKCRLNDDFPDSVIVCQVYVAIHIHGNTVWQFKFRINPRAIRKALRTSGQCAYISVRAYFPDHEVLMIGNINISVGIDRNT